MSDAVRTVLIVDDIPEDRVMFRRLLSKNDAQEYHFLESETGGEALESIRREQPDCVLLDFDLPDFSGAEILREIELQFGKNNIPVVVVSGNMMVENAVASLKQGAQDFLVKGRVTTADLNRAIENAIEKVALLQTQKQAERALEKSEERYRELFNAIDEGFCVIEMMFDENGKPYNYRFLETNPAFEIQTGLEKALRKTILQLVPTHESYWFEIYGKVALTGEAIRFTNEAAALNRWFDVYAFRVGEQQSNQVGVLFSDISELKRVEIEREKLYAREQDLRLKAESANRAKDEFLAILSHELRSPLNAMYGWATMLQKGVVSGSEAKHAVNVIERNVRLQMTLIDDLLDVSRIITGKMQLEPTSVNFVSVIESATETARPLAAAKHISIETDFAVGSCEISGDSFRLQQVVGNLLTNAVKFTPENGKIFVGLSFPSSDFVRLTVKDSGHGIDVELLPAVFDRFKQADASSKRKFGGLGLGLAIVRSLVEMHNGHVAAYSEGEGKGATFTVDLPLSKAKDADLAKSNGHHGEPVGDAEKLLDGVKILIVDDEADSLELLSFVLENKGAQVESARSAIEALGKIKDAPPDLLISDIGMADLDGIDFIRRVRSANNGTAPHLFPAIALTGFAGTEDRARALEAGFQLHLQKPVDVNKLPLTVKNLILKIQQ